MKSSCIFLLFAAGLLFLISFFPISGEALGQELSADNISQYVCDGRWNWTVFIRGPQEILSSIDHVEYQLHPTFPDPVREVPNIGDPRYPFALTTNGWGVFEISIRIFFNGGNVRVLKHMLHFDSPIIEQPLPIRTDNTATKIGDDLWKWTVFIYGPAEVIEKIQCVEYQLHPTFPNPIHEVTDRGTYTRAFPLTAKGWGTFTIKVRVFLKNGQVQNLVHKLKF